MTKEEFFQLSVDKKRSLVTDALVNLLMLEDLAPGLSKSLFRSNSLEVIKIILGAYMNGEID